jgi:hypothetical protein
VTHAGLVRIEAGEHRAARGTAARRVVKLREADAARGQAVRFGRG